MTTKSVPLDSGVARAPDSGIARIAQDGSPNFCYACKRQLPRCDLCGKIVVERHDEWVHYASNSPYCQAAPMALVNGRRVVPYELRGCPLR